MAMRAFKVLVKAAQNRNRNFVITKDTDMRIRGLFLALLIALLHKIEYSCVMHVVDGGEMQRVSSCQEQLLVPGYQFRVYYFSFMNTKTRWKKKLITVLYRLSMTPPE